MEQSRIKKTTRNLIYAVILQIVKVGLVFINRIIFVKRLGAAYLGVNGLFTDILGILSLADLGINTALMFSLYKPLSENNEEKISQYINYFKKCYNTIALIIVTVGIALIPFLKYLVNLPEEMPHIYLYYILLLLNSALSYLFVYKTTLVSADQKAYILNKYDIMFQFILFILQIGVLLLTNSFTLYLTSNILCTVLENILKVKKTQELYPYLNSYKKAVLPKKERKDIFSNLYSLFFYRLGSIIQSNTDNILISIFIGTITVGYYSNYNTIINCVVTFMAIIFTSIKASVGNYVVSNDIKEQLKMFNILETYNFWLVGFCAICFMILIPDFINICFGREYVLSYGVLICAVLNFYTSNIRQIMWTYRETTGIFKKTKYVTMTTSIINIILSIILGYFFGLVGIVGATVISRMVYAWWKEPIIIYKDYFKSSPKPYFVAYIKRFLLLVIMYIITFGACSIVTNTNIYINFILKGIITLIIPNLIMIIIYRNNDAIKYLQQNLIKKKVCIK